MFKNAETEKLYHEREARYLTAINNGTPDRIPMRFLMQEAAARYMGVTNQQVACDYNLAFEVTRKTGEKLGVDPCAQRLLDQLRLGEIRIMEVRHVLAWTSAQTASTSSRTGKRDELFLQSSESRVLRGSDRLPLQQMVRARDDPSIKNRRSGDV
jgi:hypothetical protein